MCVMRCIVLLFAQARELAGCERFVVDLPESAAVADAMEVIERQHPQLALLRNRLAIALDQRYAPPHAQLHEGCTIALIPPVSGG